MKARLLPEMTTEDRPVLLIGMHRSGTSAFSTAIAGLGVHMGQRCDAHGESTFFRRINKHLDAEAGGHWSNPGHVNRIATRAARDDRHHLPLYHYLNSIAALEYWGLRRSKPPAWGWKDPRTAPLLPLWTRVFPNCRIVVIRRHPGGIVSSLLRRSQVGRRDIEELGRRSGLRAQGALSWKVLRRGALLGDAWRIDGYEGTTRFVIEALRVHAAALAAAPEPFVVDYEQLVETPVKILSALCDELGLDIDGDRVAASASHFDSRSVDRFRHDERLMETLADHRHELLELGYGV